MILYIARSMLFSGVHAAVNHTCEYVKIPECTENFRAYTDLGNQTGCEKRGEVNDT